MINFNNSAQVNLETLGYNKQKLADGIAASLENSKQTDFILGNLWGIASLHNFANHKFQKLVDTAYSFVNAMLMNPSNMGGDYQRIVSEATKYVCYIAGAEHIMSQPGLRAAMTPQVSNAVHKYYAELPTLTAAVTQYEAQMAHHYNSSQMAFTGVGARAGSGTSSIEFTLPADSSFASSNQPTVGGFSTSFFSQQEVVNDHLGNLPTFDPTQRSVDVLPTMPIPTMADDVPVTSRLIPDGYHRNVTVPVHADPVLPNVLKITGDQVEYDNHRLGFMGENVIGTENPGFNKDFFGILTTQNEISTFIDENIENVEDSTLTVLPELDVLVYRKNAPIHAFSAEHALGILKCSLSHLEGLHCDRVATMFYYNEVEIITTYPSKEMMTLAIDASQFDWLINPQKSKTYHLVHLGDKIGAFYKPDDVKSLGTRVTEKMNIEATRLFNEAVYIEFGVKNHGLHSIDSFTSDARAATTSLIKVCNSLRGNITEHGLPENLTTCMTRKVLCLYSDMTQPVFDLLTSSHDVGDVNIDDYAGRYLYMLKRHAVLTIPHSSYELGFVVKRGPNDVLEAETPQLYNYLKKAIADMGDVKYELNSLYLHTSEGAKYRVIYDMAGVHIAIIPMF